MINIDTQRCQQFFLICLKAYHGWSTHPWSFSGWHASEESEEPRLLLNDMCHHLPKSMVCALIMHYSNYWSFTVWKLRTPVDHHSLLSSFLSVYTNIWLKPKHKEPVSLPNTSSESTQWNLLPFHLSGIQLKALIKDKTTYMTSTSTRRQFNLNIVGHILRHS